MYQTHNSRTIKEAEMHRILFSADPEIGDLPTFEPVKDLPTSSESELQELLLPSDPQIRQFEATCKSGDIERATTDLQRLLQTGVPAQDLQVCLLGAVQSGREDIVQMLLSAGTPVTLGSVKAAVAIESTRLLSLFQAHGWDVNAEEAWCIPPLLSFAVSTGATKSVLGWFLSNGADPNAACQMDITPLSTAVAEARLPVVQTLLEHCPSNTKFQGQLLHWAAARRGPEEDQDSILRLVLDLCKENINSVMYERHALSYEVRKAVGLGTPLHEAARAGRLRAARTLIAHGADTTVRDSLGNTALEVAEREGYSDVADEIRSSVA